MILLGEGATLTGGFVRARSVHAGTAHACPGAVCHETLEPAEELRGIDRALLSLHAADEQSPSSSSRVKVVKRERRRGEARWLRRDVRTTLQIRVYSCNSRTRHPGACGYYRAHAYVFESFSILDITTFKLPLHPYPVLISIEIFSAKTPSHHSIEFEVD